VIETPAQVPNEIGVRPATDDDQSLARSPVSISVHT
jgi:hypothetical protein